MSNLLLKQTDSHSSVAVWAVSREGGAIWQTAQTGGGVKFRTLEMPSEPLTLSQGYGRAWGIDVASTKKIMTEGMEFMNDYIAATFAKMDLQKICGFLLDDTSESTSDDTPYKVKLEQTHAPIYKRVTDIYKDASERTDAEDELADALNAQRDVYLEIGMKAGARLIYALLLTDSPMPPQLQATNIGNGGK
jgi:hypothetical protein